MPTTGSGPSPRGSVDHVGGPFRLIIHVATACSGCIGVALFFIPMAGQVGSVPTTRSGCIAQAQLIIRRRVGVHYSLRHHHHQVGRSAAQGLELREAKRIRMDGRKMTAVRFSPRLPLSAETLRSSTGRRLFTDDNRVAQKYFGLLPGTRSTGALLR